MPIRTVPPRLIARYRFHRAARRPAAAPGEAAAGTGSSLALPPLGGYEGEAARKPGVDDRKHELVRDE